jgi:hypothetical protein
MGSGSRDQTPNSDRLESHDGLRRDYADVLTPAARDALAALAAFDEDRQALMAKRLERRLTRNPFVDEPEAGKDLSLAIAGRAYRTGEWRAL